MHKVGFQKKWEFNLYFMATDILEIQRQYESLIPEMEIDGLSDSTEVSSEVHNVSASVEALLAKKLFISNCLDNSTIEEVFVSNASESLQVKGYIDKSERDRIVKTFIGHPKVHKENVDPNPPMYSIGSHLYASRPGHIQEDYFDKMKEENEVLSEILKGKDYLANAISSIADRLGLKFEYFNDGNGNQLEYGSLRMWGWGGTADYNGDKFVAMPHEDLIDIANRFPELEVSQPDNVYAAILCLSAGDHPAKTVVWDKIPTVQDDLDPDKKKEYWFTYDMIEGVDSYAMQLHPGDLGIFPAHKIHAVVGDGERCTLGCFFHIHNGKVIMRT